MPFIRLIFIYFIQPVPFSNSRITAVARQPQGILSHGIQTGKPGLILVQLVQAIPHTWAWCAVIVLSTGISKISFMELLSSLFKKHLNHANFYVFRMAAPANPIAEPFFSFLLPSSGISPCDWTDWAVVLPTTLGHTALLSSSWAGWLDPEFDHLFIVVVSPLSFSRHLAIPYFKK